ncbi:MAG: LamG domain-containing protein [Planctomycetes bacterium]|nr:LamG domain-containing protein [Planctomycetota bacterium]
MCKKLIYFVSFVLVLGLAGNAMAQPNPATLETGHVYLFDNVIDSNVPDDSANDNTGAILGDLSVVEGLSGQALQFDGVDDGVHLPDTAGINTSTHQNHTVVVVFKCANVDKPEKQCVYEEGGSTRGLTIYVHEGLVYVGGWNLSDYTPEWTGTFLSAPISSNQWVAVAAVLRGGGPGQEDDKFEMWMDGQFIGVGPGGQLQSRSDDNGVGNVQAQTVFHDGTVDAGHWLEGTVDEVWILNEALTEIELSNLVSTIKPFAFGPIPVDGALINKTPVDLFWLPGGLADSQNLYFGDNFDDVNAGAENTLLALGQTPVGVDIPITISDLMADTTYYWRIDAVNDANPDSPWKGQIWSFSLIQATAIEPNPADGAKFVNPTTTLSWMSGLNAESHIVYIGDNLDDVTNAAGGTPQTETNYDPGLLTKSTIYYWRVDEFDGTDTHIGDIWSFETPPDIPITDPNLVAWWKLDNEGFGVAAVDSSGYDHHGTLVGDPQWVAGYDGGALELDGSGDYVTIPDWKGINADRTDPNNPFNPAFSVACWVKTTEDAGAIVTWGSSDGTGVGGQYQSFRINAGRLRAEHGNGNLQSDTSVNDGEWHHIAQVSVEGANLRVPNTILYIDGAEDAIRGGSDNIFNITEDADVGIGLRASSVDRLYTGLFDDVRVYDKALTAGEVKIVGGFLQSSNPDPADGAKIVDSLAILTWSPGPFAAEFDVYFGTNPEPGAAELVGRVAEATYIATGLAEGQTYYWRIDDVETDGTTIHSGDVWSLWIPPRGAYNPSPADAQEVTDVDADLSWEADWNPVMFGVYFGTDADQVANAVGAPPAMDVGFDPGPLEPGTTYYWRVDVFYGTWVTGEVWSFTVPAPVE